MELLHFFLQETQMLNDAPFIIAPQNKIYCI